MKTSTNQENPISVGKGKHTSVIFRDDKFSLKVNMIMEYIYSGVSIRYIREKYGYTKQRFFQILSIYKQHGIEALMTQKTGPKKNRIRTENTENLIVRYKFLDPSMSAAVIAQKLKQQGISISQRSVMRTITEKGLSKKNFSR
ncbi:MAG TPA: helix-turn-helix domain containing protein [Ignavibacteria bacterium]